MRETKKPELKRITQKELDQKLKEYKQWRNKSPRNNERYNELSQHDLSGLSFSDPDNLYKNINLSGSNLSGVDLTGARFEWTDLTGADFSNAILTDAKFCFYTDAEKKYEGGGATLIGTKFLNATMHRTNLSGTRTAGMQLGGADVTNAILPDEIKSFDGLKTVEEASKITKRLFTMLLTALGYSALTIFSTKDHLLLTNSVSSPLPIIQAPMPLASFYWITPALLLAFYLYFLFNLLHLYKLISRLPAVFPDGTPLDEKIFPWLLNTLVREYFPRLPEKEVSMFWARKLLMVFLAWWSTPIVLASFWLRYLARHDLWGSGLHIGWIGLVITAIIVTYNKTMQILKNDPNYQWPLKWLNQWGWSVVLGALIAITIFIQLGDLNHPPRWIYKAGLKIPLGQWLIADFAEQEVSYKPDNWNSEKPTEGVKGAKLENANLDYAYARDAFLVKAKLSRASLKDATLTGAIFVGAMLDGKADLTNAHLDKANLIGANLTEAILSGVDFTGADLTGADLTGVIGIKPKQIKNAKNWQLAFYDRDFKEDQLKLSDGEVKDALCVFLAEKNPKLSGQDLDKLYNEKVKDYQKHYGKEFVTPGDKQCGKAPKGQ